MVNPLGSAKCTHKILAVYYTLSNLPPYMRSNIDHMQLVLLCKEKYLKTHGSSKIFGKLVSDVQQLEEKGIKGANGETIKGTVCAIVGDNLGSHMIGGFNECFSATYFCRYCLISKYEFLNNPLFTAELRNPMNYYIHTNSNENTYGLKSDSIFNSLSHFHVANPGLPPCLGHDLFEGVVAYDVQLYLQYFVSEGWFSFGELNVALVNFKFKGSDARDKPCPVNPVKDRLVGNAVQNWNMLRFIPLVIFRHCENSDPIWNQLILLKLICDHI